jgi:undecaprenyl diphosphate synthase
LVSTLKQELKTLNDNQIRLKAIGNIASLPPSCQQELNETIELTAQNTRMDLILALSYSSTWEIVDAVKQIAIKVKSNELEVDEIDNAVFSNHLTTAAFPNPELMIRTSGELRISNFLLWQLAYSELYFTDVLWPDFDRNELYKAIADYQQRERRFGKTSEQISTTTT